MDGMKLTTYNCENAANNYLDNNYTTLSSDELWAKAAQCGSISREELEIGKDSPLNGDKLSIENYIRDLKNTIYKQQRKIRELNEILQKEQDIRNYCHVCCNANVEPELTSDNDLSYISVGETAKGYGLYIRSGDGKPTVLVVSKWKEDIGRNVDIGVYKMNFCPECGRRLIENIN